MSDFDPVEIEINLKQNAETEGEKAARSIDNISDASGRMKAELQETIALQKKVISELKTSLADVTKEFDKVNIGTNDEKIFAQRQKLSKVVKDLRAELKGEESALEDLEKRASGTAVKMKSLETRIRETREAMAALKLAGKENSGEYEELEKRLGLLATTYREVYKTQNELSKGGAQMEGVLSGLRALSGLLSAGAGAFGLLNTESENFEKIETKVQSLIAITIGLQEISNTLHSTSAFRITTVAKAKLLWASATNKLSVALGISNVAAKALMATLTLGLSVAITAIIALVDRYVSKQKKAAEEQKKISDAVSEAAGEQISSFEKLKKSYEALGDDVKAQKKFLSDNKGEFEKLGIAVDNVNSAERAFSQEGTDAFRTAVIERAKSLAIMELAAERYKEIVTKQMKLGKMSDTISDYSSAGAMMGGGMLGAGSTSAVYVGQVENRAKTKLNDEINKDLADWQKMIDEALLHEGNASAALSGAGIKGYNKIGAKAEDKVKAAGEKLAKMNADIQAEIDAATVAAMQEGEAQKEAALKAQYDKQKAIIEQKLKEVAELEQITGKPATEQRSLLGNWAKAEDEKYKAEIEQLRKVASEEIQTIMVDVEDRFKTHLESQISDINRNYNDRIKKLRELNAEEARIAEVEKAREKEIILVKNQSELEKLDFETQIDLRRQKIKDRAILFDTQKQENLLNIEKSGAEKRLQKLREIEATGADVADEIAEVTTSLQEMNAELEDMPVNKLQEMLGVLQSVVGADSKFGQLLSGISGHLKSVQQLSSAKNLGQSILGGASVIGGLYSLGKSFEDAQAKKAQEEQQKYYEAQQRYITNMIKLIELQTKALKDLKGEEKISGSKSTISQLEQDNANLEKNAKKNIRIFEKFTTESKLKWYGYVTQQKAQYKDLSGYSMEELTRMRDLWLTNQEEFKGKYGGLFVTEEDFKVLDDYVNQYQATQEQIRDIQNQVNENLTGSTYDSILSGIVDAFSDGTMTAEEFGDNFNSIMKKSIMNAFARQYLEKQLEGWYDEFAKASEGGLTAAEIEELRKGLQIITSDAQNGLAVISEASGIDLSAAGTDARQGSSKALAAASQDSIDDLSGRITNIQGIVADIRSYSAQKLDIERERSSLSLIIQSQLATIADNTYYCRYLESMSRTLDDINVKGVKLKT